MKNLFDDSEIDIDCPHCDKPFAKRIRDMKRAPKFGCPHCGGGFDASSLVSDVGKVGKRLDDAMKAIDGTIRIDLKL